MNNFQRVQQWLTFSRQWHLLDARFQCPDKLAVKIASYLKGSHKPIYHPHSDCGDHVIVYNCRHIALKAFDWKHREYFFHTDLVRGNVNFKAWEIHRHQPTRILYMAVYKQLGDFDRETMRRMAIERLHVFPDTDIPSALSKNVSNQMEQVMRVPKAFDEYTDQERRSFPALFDWPKNFVFDPGNK